MRNLTADDVQIGLRVLHAGTADGGDVLDPARRTAGHVLGERHPGVVLEILGRQHVIVRFVGLEDEPISWAVGFGYDPATGVYPGLLLPQAGEWDAALASGWWRSPDA